MYCGLVCVRYSVVSETTSVFPSKQCSCGGLRTILRWHWSFPTTNCWTMGVFLSLSKAGLWKTVLTDKMVHWADGKSEPLNAPSKITLSCSRCLVGIKMAETCWFNLTFLTPSPVLAVLFIQITCRPYDVTLMYWLSVVFDQAVTVNFLNLYLIWIMHDWDIY